MVLNIASGMKKKIRKDIGVMESMKRFTRGRLSLRSHWEVATPSLEAPASGRWPHQCRGGVM